MANWEVCFNWMMDFEDATRAYATVKDAAPAGWTSGPVFAISGINSAAFPGEFEAINAIAQHERALAVEQFYQRNFWNKWLEQITSDEVAKRVFDAAVNMGPGTAVKLLQKAIEVSKAIALAVDGQWGPNTVYSTNGCDISTLVAAFQEARKEHYLNIVATNPKDAQYLPKWLARASK
jgi:lysozyme family protein